MVWPHQWDVVAGILSHLKMVVAYRAMESPVIAVLDIREDLIPCAWILWVVHVQNVYDHTVDKLCLAIGLGMEGCGLSEFGVQHQPETRPKCTEEPIVLIWDDRLWDPKVYPHSFKEDFSSGFCFDILLTSCHNGHLRESVDDHKNTVVAMLSIRKAWHVIHGDGFSSSTKGG